LQIDAAAKFISSVGDFSFAYSLAWAPEADPATLNDRHRPIFEVILAMRTQAAAVSIAGPDHLALAGAKILLMATQRGLGHSFDATLFGDVSLAVEAFQNAARELRPAGQKSGRKSGNRRSLPSR
jgi:hypothetical protein